MHIPFEPPVNMAYPIPDVLLFAFLPYFLTWQIRFDIPHAIMIDELDKQVISCIQGDLPLQKRPFALMAERIGITEQEFLDRVAALREKGVLRRFGATLRHQEAGYRANAMVAWRVPEAMVETVGERLAAFREVTHCYERAPAPDWPYNLYTMIHGNSREACREIAEKMSQAVGVEDYSILFSEKEFKKTSMAYY